MRSLLIFVLILFTGGPVSAKVKQVHFDGRLISYGQLMRLSPEKRIAYMHEVAGLLAEMEKAQHIYEVADSDLSELKDQVAFLTNFMNVIPHASAQSSRAGSQGGRALEADCGDSLVWSRYTRSCVTPEMLTAQKAEDAAREARKAADSSVSKEPVVIRSGTIGPDGMPIGTVKQGLAGGPSGTEATQDCGKTLKWSRYSRNCVNSEILVAQKEESEAREARRIADLKVVKDPVFVGSGRIGPDGMPIGTVKQGLAGGPSGTEATQDCGKALKWSRYSRNCVNDEILSAQVAAEEAHEARLAADKSVAKELVVVGSGQLGPDGQMIGTPKQGLAGGPSGVGGSSKCGGGDLKWSRFSESCVNDEILTAQKKENEAKDARKIADSMPPEAVAPDLKSTGGEPPKDEKVKENAPPVKCEKPAFACGELDSTARDSAIAEFRADRSSNVCIAGGYFSKYETPKKAAGKCVVQTQFERTGKKPVICPQPKEKGQPRVAMCNPTVFCLGLKVDAKLTELMKNDPDVKKVVTDSLLKNAATIADTKEKVLPVNLCAPVGQDLTEQCNKSLMDHLEGRSSRFGNSKGESYVACDSSKLTDFPYQNEYAALRAGVEEKYKAQCNSGQTKFMALFCTECKIIGERIYGMNEKATGQGCAADAPAGSPNGGAPGSPEGVREKAGG